MQSFTLRMAFYGLPNNDLHSSRYINLISQTKDEKELEKYLNYYTFNNKPNNWKNFLIIASSFYPPGDKYLVEKAEKARNIFPKVIKNLKQYIDKFV